MRKLLMSVVAAFIISIVAVSILAQEHRVEDGESSLHISNNDPITINTPVYAAEQDTTSPYSGQFMNTNDDGDSWNEQGKAEAHSDELIEKLLDHGENAAEDKQEKEDEKNKEDDDRKKDKGNGDADDPEGETLSLESTAYTASCEGCSGVTRTGVDLDANPDEKVIAVDPDVIPLESEVYVEDYGYATAEDTGGDIKGDRVDLFIPSEEDAMDWGRQTVDVTIIDEHD